VAARGGKMGSDQSNKRFSELELEIEKLQRTIKYNSDSPMIDMYRESLKRTVQKMEKEKELVEKEKILKEIFDLEVENAVSHYEKAIGRISYRTRQMLEQYGNERALSLLMDNADIQRGFRVLRNINQLDKTFEAVIVRHKNRFAAEKVEVAQWRLDQVPR
jgi:vacuolar-type H+-ATPase catalytic subunit A/Vma1